MAEGQPISGSARLSRPRHRTHPDGSAPVIITALICLVAHFVLGRTVFWPRDPPSAE
jgi:hypothetical protein